MFLGLSDKFQNLFSKFTGKTRLTEANIEEGVRAVRNALLEADVNYSVANHFVKRVKEQALGLVAKNQTAPSDKFITIVHEELVHLMGEKEPSLHFNKSPSVWMLVGLQGVGKTTQAVKLARFLKQKPYYRSPLLVACDLQRPAAVEQLAILAQKEQIPCFTLSGESKPQNVAEQALKFAKQKEHDLLILDTAGRLHVDEELMAELVAMKQKFTPDEVLFVASAASGQDAVRVALEFDQKVGITGSVLTMLDGSSRAGAALSILEMTHKPLKFEGTGEKMQDLQLFHPVSMADRILGMGDLINLMKKAEASLENKESLAKKNREASFSYQDYLDQMEAVQKMGSIGNLLSMIPGASKLPLQDVEGIAKKAEVMIRSMTLKERNGEEELDHQRRLRIAKGSGTSIDDVNKLVKKFKEVRAMVKKLPLLKKAFGKTGSFGNFF